MANFWNTFRFVQFHAACICAWAWGAKRVSLLFTFRFKCLLKCDVYLKATTWKRYIQWIVPLHSVNGNCRLHIEHNESITCKPNTLSVSWAMIRLRIAITINILINLWIWITCQLNPAEQRLGRSEITKWKQKRHIRLTESTLIIGIHDLILCKALSDAYINKQIGQMVLYLVLTLLFWRHSLVKYANDNEFGPNYG